MKTIIGSAIGVLAIGLILVGVGLRGSASNTPASFPVYAASPNGAVALPVDNTSRTAASGPVMVNCAPGQRALVRQVFINNEPVSQVACVADPSAGLVAYDGMQAAPVARPVSYRTSQSTAVSERRVVYQDQAPRRVAQPQRSLKKQLLVIGGSTAAGAGIGGIIGGKKGALIGAALGGGASTLYEATRK